MEQTRSKPMVLLTLLALLLGVIALSQLAARQSGPICAEAVAAQPGFTAMTGGPAPACIRIRLP